MLHSVPNTLRKQLHSLGLQLSSTYKMRVLSKPDGELQIEMIAGAVLQTGKLRSLLRAAATKLQPIFAMWECQLHVARSCNSIREAGSVDFYINIPLFKCLENLLLTVWDWCFFTYRRTLIFKIGPSSECLLEISAPPHLPSHLLNQNLRFNKVPRLHGVIQLSFIGGGPWGPHRMKPLAPPSLRLRSFTSDLSL